LKVKKPGLFVNFEQFPCSWIRIIFRIPNADPDPGQLNKCGSFNYVLYYDFFSSGSRRAEEDKYHGRDWGDTEEYRRGEERYEHDYFFSRGSVFGTAFISLQLA
jgi:hypothetical protein